MKIAYIIIAHQDPVHVARLARLLLVDGGLVAIHLDGNAGRTGMERLRQALGEDAARIQWPRRRARVAWGEWSIVDATLLALEAVERSGETVDYVQLLSGSDYPIRPLSELRGYLERTGGDFIECYDMAREPWIKGGITHERYRYRHLVNERRRPRLFSALWQAQNLLGLQRRFPKGLMPHVGAQWWTLTWATCLKVLAAGRDPALRRFFKSVWIPDEMFIQTIVAAGASHQPRHRRCLTLFQFTDYGVPVVYANDHAGYLVRQPFFFARKISRHADRLRDELDAVVRGQRHGVAVPDHAIGQRTCEYERVAGDGRLPQPGRRVPGRDRNLWRGDLDWNARPFVAVLGLSRQELAVVQQVMQASGRIECHGDLFAANEIEFAGFRPSFAGYTRNDTRLRDSRATTFLVDVLAASTANACAFLLPHRKIDEMRDKILWHANASVLLVRGNMFRAFLEQQPTGQQGGQSVGRAAGWVSPVSFGAFSTVAEAYHKHVVATARASGVTFAEVCLFELDWWQQLHAFIDCTAPPPADGKVSPIAAVTAEQAARLLSALPDPAASIVNLSALSAIRLTGDDRARHRLHLEAGERSVAAGKSARGVASPDQVG